MVAVAAMTQAGFAGNLRYVALPAALVCVLAGAGWVVAGARPRAPLRHASPRPRSPSLIAAASAPFVVDDVDELDHDRRAHRGRRPTSTARVPRGDRKAGGGEAKLKRCGTVYTGAFQTQAVAWYMHLHEIEVGDLRLPAGHDDRAAASRALSRDPRFPTIAKTRKLGHRLVLRGAG